AQELLTFRHQARWFEPEVVILAMYTQNDIFNNSRALNPTSFPHLSPYYRLIGDSLVLDDAFREHVVLDVEQRWFRRLRIAATARFLTARLLYDQRWAVVRPRVLQILERIVRAPGAESGDDEDAQPDAV